MPEWAIVGWALLALVVLSILVVLVRRLWLALWCWWTFWRIERILRKAGLWDELMRRMGKDTEKADFKSPTFRQWLAEIMKDEESTWPRRQ